ncbi:MAG: UDP-N-acetylmuramate dehydrogenase [Bacilli bacterium]|nr:UDP-N-acetylmuramate dehydrogenase [Bacilli bacterium]MDD4718650.1 UDP-N-acetylmuramate dehydrogenase [Bacilli bacterium]
MDLIAELKKLKCGKIKVDVPLKDYTTYRLSGNAKVVVYPNDIDQLTKLLAFIKENVIKYKIIGNGSNIIFATNYYDGVLIKLSEFNNLIIDDTKIIVGAGYNLTKLAYNLSKRGLTGFEFAPGIPGTVGGAVYMNAGAYKSDMGYIVSEIKVLTPGLEIKTMYNQDLDFHYRTSFLQKNPGYICLEVTIILKHGNVEVINDLIAERKKRRLMTQPLEYPSAGSVFRNPEGDSAWRLIEAAGYKGKIFNNIEVSDKHANFIINPNGGSGIEIKNLIEQIKKDVKKQFNVDLIVEQEIIE